MLHADARASLLAVLALASLHARAEDAACAALAEPQVGAPGKDVLWEPTPDAAVARMLALAAVTQDDHVFDLGSGDGRIPIAAARERGARASGIEYTRALVEVARCRARAAGLEGRVDFIEGDVFLTDFSRATVVTTYLLPEMNLCLRARVLAMAPGTRVAAYRFAMADWQPDATERTGAHDVFSWVVPARVEGTWALEDGGGRAWRIALSQSFQNITGALVVGAARRPLTRAQLRGDAIVLAFVDERGVSRTLSARVDGARMEGVLSSADGEVIASARALGPIRVGAWATTPPLCDRFTRASASASEPPADAHEK